jgi:hypothetical protein
MSDELNLTLARRIERLERAERRWRTVAATAVLGVAAVVLMGQKPAPRIVEAERFILRDAAGRVRAELAVESEQSVALRFRDPDTMPRLSIGTENGASVLVLNEQGGKVRAGLVTLPHGAPALTLYDPNGKNRAELALTREGAPALTILDRDGFLAWKTPNGP